jgi:integrase/recombinase XerD
MSSIRQELDRYLTIRRSLGYDLATTARLLRRFAAFAETQDAEHVNTDLFLKWQASFGQARLGMVRLFAQWLHGLDPTHEVPARGLIPHRARRSLWFHLV